MSQSYALIPSIIDQKYTKTTHQVAIVLSGVTLLSLLAQITIYLPFTPVPITGQTFGVACVSLLWGRKLSTKILFSYLLAGGLGLPIFAMAKSGFTMGPTAGYLIGMFFSSMAIGFLADRGWSKSCGKAWIACTIGSLITFTFGLAWLSYFVKFDQLLYLGLFPFLIGDLIKNILASKICSTVYSKMIN